MEERGKKGSENPPVVRIFVGGLGEAVTADELRRVFELCGGAVDSIDFVRSKGRSFAYVDFSPSSHNTLSNLFAKYNGCVWKGGKLRLEKAKEHYVKRLALEWAEAAEAVAKADVDANAHQAAAPCSSSEVPQDESDKRKIRIFFPRLRKVKVLPFSGTGKHKYSFRRIEVSSLPKYLCDCEEHSGPTERGRQILHVEAESDGMNQEEVNIMNKVMNTLFQKKNYDSPDVPHKGTSVVDNGDDSFKSIGDLHCEENEADEDDLIINVASKGNNKVGSLERQRFPQLSHDQPKKGTLEQRSKRGRSQDAFTMQKENANEPPSKKKKRLSRDLSSRDELKSALSASKGNFHHHSDKLSKLTEIQHAEPQSDKRQSNVHVSWSQKSSWKALVGDKSSNTFSIASTEEGHRRSVAANVPHSDNQKENLEIDSIVSTGKGQLRCDASDAPDSDGETEKLVADGQLEGRSFKKKTEGLIEAQAAEPKIVSSQTRQGASWMQKSSWTELVGQNSSFSISQPFPGTTSAQHVPAKPGTTGVSSSDNEKLNEIGNPARYGPSVLKTKAEDVSMKSSLKDDKQIIMGNESSTSLLEENCGVAVEQTSPVKVEISETCTFMRNANSLKEWAKAKAALSGSLKGKGNQK